MLKYIFKRLLLIIPTLLGIMLVNFIIINFAPGGPVEQAIAKYKGFDSNATERISKSSSDSGITTNMNSSSADTTMKYRGSTGLDPEFIKKLEKMYGFDKPPHERFFLMIRRYCTFDFGESYFKGKKVVELIAERLPVSISLGLWTTLLVYFISIPLGIRKALKNGSKFDLWSSTAIIIGYAIPSFIFAVLLIVLFAGGNFLKIFPLGHLVSENWRELPLPNLILDYFYHMALPIIAMVIGSFASLTMFSKNSFLEEINKQYVMTARAKGLTENRVLFGHVFRNAMLIIIAGLPGTLVHILFTGSVLIETIFSLDGLGLLGYEAAMNRDYPLLFADLFILSLLGLLLNLIGDIIYTLIDPRIDFESREV